MKLIERYTMNPSFEEALARLDAAYAIERFKGSIEAYEAFKGGQRFEIIDTGTPKKFVEGGTVSSKGILADAILVREGLLFKVMGKLAIPVVIGPFVNSTLLRAYDLGAKALVNYSETRLEIGIRCSGTPVRPVVN